MKTSRRDLKRLLRLTHLSADAPKSSIKYYAHTQTKHPTFSSSNKLITVFFCLIIFEGTMADPKPYLDPAARRGQPHSQFWYDLSVNDPKGMEILESMVIARHNRPITVLDDEHHEKSEEMQDIFTAVSQGAFTGFCLGLFWGISSLAWNPDMMFMTKKGPVLAVPTANYVTRGLFVPALYASSVGATYLGVKALSHRVRGECDFWNAGYGGFAAGLVMGSVTKRIDRTFLTAAGIAFVGAVGDWYDRNGRGSLVCYDRETAYRRYAGLRPYQHKESDELRALKEKYPEHSNI